ncbi:MAG: hypothetical protein JEZ02_00155 [Desulfatibacillum sp.]|nr:hypothetical protein [Desulfatibacillum sp.]
MSDNDIKKDFAQAYERAHAYWAPFLSEAKTDLSVMLGDQWDASAKKYLEKQRRSALVFNKVRRVVKLIEGYQRKNRLALKVDPVEGSDQTTATQLSALCQWQMQSCNAYHIMSDAFAGGALKTGINLVNLYVDYSHDPLNGDIKIKRVPYNRFLLDPAFSERDLSDCGYICRRELLSKDAIRAILPASKRHMMDKLKPKGVADGKYEYGALARGSAGDNLFRYDEFWTRTHKPLTILLDPSTGQSLPWKGDAPALERLLSSHPHLKILETMRRSVELAVFVEDQLIHQGPEPGGLEDFPFVPILGFFEPEYDQASWKLQGIVRCMRDPQTEVNKRRSKMLDIIDSQISTGWKARENSVVNPEALYQSGQGQVVWMKGDMDQAQRLLPPDIPAGLMQLSETLDRDIMEIPGANSELFGMAESDTMQVAGILAKMRQAAGLTILQDIFDNYRLAKKLVGHKLIKLIQANYTPQKVARILGQQPSREFFTGDFGKYDAIPVEGVLSDTQRQMYFAQLVSLKQMGAPIPWKAILDAAPIEDKGRLQTMVEAEEQARTKASQSQAALARVQEELARARIRSDLAGAAQKQTQARKNLTAEAGERVRTARDIAEMDRDQLRQAMPIIRTMQKEANHAPDHHPGTRPVFP